MKQVGIKGLLTDLDGTLCNTEEANVAAYTAAFADAKVPFNEAGYRENFGLDFHSMMKQIATGYADKWEYIATRKSVHYKTSLHLITPNVALIDILKDAKRNGKKIGVASTAKRANAEVVLAFLGIADLFDAMLFAEDVSHKKPHPECYATLMKLLALHPAQCIVFEDTDIGVNAGTAAGAHVLRVRA